MSKFKYISGGTVPPPGTRLGIGIQGFICKLAILHRHWGTDTNLMLEFPIAGICGLTGFSFNRGKPARLIYGEESPLEIPKLSDIISILVRERYDVGPGFHDETLWVYQRGACQGYVTDVMAGGLPKNGDHSFLLAKWELNE